MSTLGGSLVRNSTEIKRNTVALSAVVIFVFTAAAAASPIADGRFDPAEGYTVGRYVDFTVERAAGPVDQGQLWTYVDAASGDVYVAFIQPLNLVDNTYGANSIGWGKDAPSGKHHNFDDLVGSDKAQFIFTDALGQAVLDITVDYISKTGTSYHSLGVTGGDGSVKTGSAASVLAWGTSLDYNFNKLGYALTTNSPATDANYTENASYPGWLFEVSYELRIAGSAFGSSGFGNVTVPSVHDSPNKIGKNKIYTEIDGAVPEPASISLLAFGALWFARRRRR